MKIRLGYACISETIEGTSSSTYSYTKYKEEKDDKKLEKIISSNLFHLQQLLLYNNKNNHGGINNVPDSDKYTR